MNILQLEWRARVAQEIALHIEEIKSTKLDSTGYDIPEEYAAWLSYHKASRYANKCGKQYQKEAIASEDDYTLSHLQYLIDANLISVE